MTYILGIETSCDETAAAVVEGGRRLLSNVVASQEELHAQYGGIFPEMASRAHIEAIWPVVEQAMAQSGLPWERLDAVAVTCGPGLVGSLLVGVNFAKGLALGRGLPLLGINHLEAHLYAIFLTERDADPVFPLLALLVSGGHTELVLMREHGVYERLGGAIDDAAGEAFDKVGRLLGLPYPGGPAVEKAASLATNATHKFPRAWLEDSYDFSFSGLKTAVLRAVYPNPGARSEPGGNTPPPGTPVPALALSFQEAVVEVLATKTVRAAEEFGATEIFIAGGVAANQALRRGVEARASVPVSAPPLSLCTDNAAMVAAVGHFRFMAGQEDGLGLDVRAHWLLSEM